MQRVLMLSGACGVGKSATLTPLRDEIAARSGEAAVIESDLFYMMIDPRWTMPPERVERYFEVSGWLMRETAMGFLRFGFAWVVIAGNGWWSEDHVREFVAPLLEAGASVHHVTLDPGTEVACERLAERDSTAGWYTDAEQLRRSGREGVLKVRAHAGAWTHVIDNAALTPAQTAAAIIEAVEGGAGTLLPR